MNFRRRFQAKVLVAPMSKLKKTTIVIVLLVAVYVVMSLFRDSTAKHALRRLKDTGIIKQESDVEMLWSSGLLRDNTSIYKWIRHDALPSEFRSLPLASSDEEVEKMFLILGIDRAQVDQAVKGGIDWKNAGVWSVDGTNLLSLLFVVRTPDQIFLILKVF